MEDIKKSLDKIHPNILAGCIANPLGIISPQLLPPIEIGCSKQEIAEMTVDHRKLEMRELPDFVKAWLTKPDIEDIKTKDFSCGIFDEEKLPILVRSSLEFCREKIFVNNRTENKMKIKLNSNELLNSFYQTSNSNKVMVMVKEVKMQEEVEIKEDILTENDELQENIKPQDLDNSVNILITKIYEEIQNTKSEENVYVENYFSTKILKKDTLRLLNKMYLNKVATENNGSALLTEENKIKIIQILKSTISAIENNMCCIKSLESHTKLQEYNQLMEKSLLGLNASNLALSIINAPNTTKNMIIESSIITSISFIKKLLKNDQIGLIIQNNDFNDNTGKLEDVYFYAQKESLTKLQKAILAHIVSSINLIKRFYQSETMTEPIMISLVFLLNTAFFIEHNIPSIVEKEPVGLKILKTNCFDLYEIIFAMFPEQREWIVKELFVSITEIIHHKKESSYYYLLKNGEYIQNSTALFLKLLHCSSTSDLFSDPSFLSKITDPKNHKETISLITESSESMNELLKSTASLCRIAFDILLKKLIAKDDCAYLNLYSSLVLDLIKDLLLTLNYPDWPASSLALSVFCKLAKKEFKKQQHTFAYGVYIEALALICIRIKKHDREAVLEKLSKILEELLLIKKDETIIKNLHEKNKKKISFIDKLALFFMHYGLLKKQHCSHLSQSSVNFFLCQEFVDLSMTFNSLNEETQNEISNNFQKEQNLCFKTFIINQAYLDELGETKLYNLLHLIKEIAAIDSCFYLDYEKYITYITGTTNEPSLSFRTKATKSLALIATYSYNVLENNSVRTALEARLSDVYISVREAAIDAISKYLLSVNCDLLECSYYHLVCDRINDTGHNVRKKAIKTLKQIFKKTDNVKTLSHIAYVFLVRDQTNVVQEDSAKLFSEVVSQKFALSFIKHKSTESAQLIEETNQPVVFTEFIYIASELFINSKNKSLEEFFTNSMSCSNNPAAASQVSEMIDCFLNKAMNQDFCSEKNTTNTVVYAIYLFSLIEGYSFENSQFTIIQSLLDESLCISDEESIINIMKILHKHLVLVDGLLKSTSNELESTLKQTLLKCSKKVLKYTVPTLVGLKTLSYDRTDCLFYLFSNTLELLKKISCNKKEDPNIPRLLIVVSLFLEEFQKHSYFNHVAYRSNIGFIQKSMLASIHTVISYTDQAYSTVIRSHAIEGLGHICLSYPKLYSEEALNNRLNHIMDENNHELSKQIILNFNEFLLMESKTTRVNTPKNFSVSDKSKKLTNNSRICSIISDRYLDWILKNIVLTQNNNVQSLSLVGLTIIETLNLGGFVHPLKCIKEVSVFCTVTTNKAISTKAIKIYNQIINKHGSLLVSSKDQECIEAIYQYFKNSTPIGDIRGYNTLPSDQQHKETSEKAVLDFMYNSKSKLNEKLNLLQFLTNAFDININQEYLKTISIRYIKFCAENIATFSYSQSEEIKYILSAFKKVISICGSSLIFHLDNSEDRGGASQAVTPVLLAKAVATITIAILTKKRLDYLYRLKTKNSLKRKDSCTENLTQHSKLIHNKPIKMPFDYSQYQIDCDDDFFHKNTLNSQFKQFETLFMDEDSFDFEFE